MSAPDGRVISVNVSAKKGVQKEPVASVTLVPEPPWLTACGLAPEIVPPVPAA